MHSGATAWGEDSADLGFAYEHERLLQRRSDPLPSLKDATFRYILFCYTVGRKETFMQWRKISLEGVFYFLTYLYNPNEKE